MGWGGLVGWAEECGGRLQQAQTCGAAHSAALHCSPALAPCPLPTAAHLLNSAGRSAHSHTHCSECTRLANASGKSTRSARACRKGRA